MMRRRSGARWAMLAFLIIHGGATILADAFLFTPTAEGTVLRGLLLAQLLLAGAALVLSILRSAEAWFRAE